MTFMLHKKKGRHAQAASCTPNAIRGPDLNRRAGERMKQRVARDIMHRKVVTVAPDTSLRDVIQLFLQKQITGAPVVDDGGKILGVVSQTDLLRYEQRATLPPSSETPSFYQASNGDVLVTQLQKLEAPPEAQVQDIMTPAAFMTEESTPISAIARFMLRRHVHRILVTRKGKLAGILTSMDLLRTLLNKPSPRKQSAKRPALKAA